MSVEASRERARAAASRLPQLSGDISEGLRADVVAFCTRVPEPPVYVRRDDPARLAAAALIADGEALLARAYQAGDQAWIDAVDAWVEVLHHIVDGKVASAEVRWVEAQRLEGAASGQRRLFARSDELPTPVFDAQTRQSRFDPRPERSVQVKVPCPGCRKVSTVNFSPRLAHHAITCVTCARTYEAYFGEVRSAEITRSRQARTYAFRLQELAGPQTRLEVEDRSSGELQVARGDLLGFLYHPRGVLRGVLNLSSSRVLWLTSGGPCFVATVAFGDDAPELEVLRRYRDGVLRRRWSGRLFVRAYYALGPSLAQVVTRVPGARPLVRRGLRSIVDRLEARA